MPVKTKSWDEAYLYVYNEETSKFELVGRVSEVGEYDGEEPITHD